MIIGKVFVTPHAIDRLVRRVAPSIRRSDALEYLLLAFESAHFVRPARDGAAMWKASRKFGRMRLIIAPPSPGRHLPQLVTVMHEYDK